MVVLTFDDIESFKEVLKYGKRGFLFIDLSTSWCGPCKRIAPIYEEVAKEYEEHEDVFFAKTNKADDAEIMNHLRSSFGYDLVAFPSFIVLCQGTLWKDWKGGDEDKLRSSVKKYVMAWNSSWARLRGLPVEKDETSKKDETK